MLLATLDELAAIAPPVVHSECVAVAVEEPRSAQRVDELLGVPIPVNRVSEVVGVIPRQVAVRRVVKAPPPEEVEQADRFSARNAEVPAQPPGLGVVTE